MGKVVSVAGLCESFETSFWVALPCIVRPVDALVVVVEVKEIADTPDMNMSNATATRPTNKVCIGTLV